MGQQNGGGWQAVKEDGKQRFGLLEEGGQLLIRANQGHSINVIPSIFSNQCFFSSHVTSMAILPI
jgi:RNA:NAD 2'-phosphotransferase (TPT1/KptA family)